MFAWLFLVLSHVLGGAGEEREVLIASFTARNAAQSKPPLLHEKCDARQAVSRSNRIQSSDVSIVLGRSSHLASRHG